MRMKAQLEYKIHGERTGSGVKRQGREWGEGRACAHMAGEGQLRGA